MKAGHKRTPWEEQELERKRRDFYALERRLARLEHDLEDVRDEIREFEKLYTTKMADRITELDTLKSEIAKARSEEVKSTTGGTEEAQEPQETAEAPEEMSGRLKIDAASIGRSDSIRDIYRKVAKTIHPDLARDEEERKKRQKLMAEANRAYAEEDRITLMAIMEEWELGPEIFTGGREGELAVVNRRIDRISEQIRVVEREIARLKNTDLYRLIQRVQEAKWRGRDILTEMAAKLDADILAACRTLNETGKKRQEGSEAPPQGAFRTVRFPADRGVGSLFIRERSSGNFLDWRKLGEAVGDVTVPAGKSLRLDVREGGAAELDLLTDLSPYDLQACFLYGATDAELAHILRFKGIEELYLSGSGITAEGLVHLLELGGLERLYLYDTAVTDAGLAILKYLGRLRFLTICNASVSEAGLAKLKGALPSCRIVNLHGARK